MTAEALLVELDKLGCKQGDRLPSDRVLASRLGMRHSTVNRLLLELAAHGNVVKEGRRRYRPLTGQLPEKRQLPLVRVFAPSTLYSVFEKAGRYFPQMRLHFPNAPEQLKIRRELSSITPRDTAGVILWPIAFRPELRRLKNSGVRVVTFGREHDPEFHTVGMARLELYQFCLDHLVAHGHEEIACVAGRLPGGQESLDSYRRLMLGKGGSRSAKRTFVFDDEKELYQTMRGWMRTKHPPTALLLTTPGASDPVMRACKRLGLRVPADLSIIMAASHRSQSPDLLRTRLTAFENPHPFQAFQALSMMAALLDEPDEARSSPYAFLFFPAFHPGFTVNDRKAGRSRAQPEEPEQFGWPLDPLERQQALRKANWLPYSRVKSGRQRQRSISLASVANRSVLGKNSWLPGAPLSHLPFGRPLIHGVEFDLPKPKGRKRTFLLIAGGESRRALPTRAVLAIEGNVEALYFLHVCGFAVQGKKIGSYILINEREQRFEIPLIPHEEEDRNPATNIQDWWPGYPQRNRLPSHHYIIAEDDDPLEYERYLYTLEWVNPSPGIPLREMVCEMEETNASLLGLLGLTAVGVA